MRTKKILEVFLLDQKDEIKAKGPHGEDIAISDPHFYLKLDTPFSESLEHAFYFDLKSWETADLYGFEDRLDKLIEEAV